MLNKELNQLEKIYEENKIQFINLKLIQELIKNSAVKIINLIITKFFFYYFYKEYASLHKSLVKIKLTKDMQNPLKQKFGNNFHSISLNLKQKYKVFSHSKKHPITSK